VSEEIHRFGVLITTLALSGGCASTPPRDAPVVATSSDAGLLQETPVMPATSASKVSLASSSGEQVVSAEIVSTPRALARGLMYRQHLPPDAGMLFLMGQRAIHTFWMRNTLIPLDMIFIDQDMTVVGIVENATPRTETQRSVNAPSLYVLEVNGGWARAHGVSAGARVRFEGITVPTPAR
jgi:uncharacterized membrane protein (UPF0127 family)